MTEALSLAGMTVMCEGKDQLQFGGDVSPCSPRGEEILRMRQELEAARRSIAEKDEKMCRMSRIQDSVDAEVQELTEKLFQEAYRMVNYAEERRERAEKLLNESKLQVEVLTAEVAALKVLVQTPGMGHNHFLHTSPEHKSALAKLFSTSSSAKRSSSSGSLPPRKSSTMPVYTSHTSKERERETEQKAADLVEEVDPILMSEFTSWREAGHPFAHHPFIDRINIEEITPCMLFHAKDLSDAILDSIASNKLELEPVHEDKPSVMPCALTNVSRFCPYRFRVSEDAEWHRISLLARNRDVECRYAMLDQYLNLCGAPLHPPPSQNLLPLPSYSHTCTHHIDALLLFIAAVCDYYTFIRYLRQGLIKSGVRDSYFDIMTLRKNMCLAKLGLGFVPKTNLRPGF